MIGKVTGAAPEPAQAGVSRPNGASGVEGEIRKTIEVFIAAYNKGDAAAIAATFTQDGELVDPSGTITRGREQVQAPGIFPPRIGVGKVHADIAEACGPEHRIGDSVTDDVGIRMSF